MYKKGQLQVSFGWLFAIIAGIFILALAIYFSVRFIDLGQQTSGAETVSEISALLNPLETSFEASKTSSLEFSQETRIKNVCRDFSNFGTQTLELEQKSFGSFERIDTQSSLENKYIFSNTSVQGERFFLFSKAFEMPFSVSSLIYLTSEEEEFCFVDIPSKLEDVEEELENLNQSNIKLEDNAIDCDDESVKICFDSSLSQCDVKVDTFSKSVTKQGSEGIEEMYYETDALMYAAIFSNEEVYECQIKRLMKRLNQISLIYQDKATILAGKECFTDTTPGSLANTANSLTSSEDLVFVKNTADNLNQQNKVSRCELW